MAVLLDLRGKHALVCGASSGLGEACARAFARAEAEVTVLARSADKLEELRGRLESEGARATHAIAVDMDDLQGFAHAILTHLEAHGPIHVSVHNTGGPASGPILEKTEEDILAVFARHQLTAHFLVRALLPAMVDAGYGRFVQILSTSAREPIANLGLSNSVRAGMLGWAKTVANELPPRVTINNVLPGYTATDRLAELKAALAARTGRSEEEIEAEWVAGIPEGRLGEPDEVAAAVLFLASPLASYIRGQSLAVEGGRLKGL